ncbi:hypothetical protein C8R43DRAFT_1052457 [Mycena crocata]|nr:hypothetical protein C8R43DRAFT_1052457 [Mycena crocata]
MVRATGFRLDSGDPSQRLLSNQPRTVIVFQKFINLPSRSRPSLFPPTSMAHDRIYIRQYRPSDLPQIRTLLFEGFVTSEDSVAVVAKRRFLFKGPSLVAYLLGSLGLGLIARSASWTSLAAGAGAALCAVGVGIFGYVQRGIPRAMVDFCENALATDMRDIAAHYCAPGAFFVAVQPRNVEQNDVDWPKGSGEGDVDAREEVVGYVGLEYRPTSDAHQAEAEVRRMVVGAAHRRRGIAARLMRAVIAHGERVTAEGHALQAIKLSTSEFQPGAQRLYEKLGWELARVQIRWDSIVRVSILHYRRPVGKAV